MNILLGKEVLHKRELIKRFVSIFKENNCELDKKDIFSNISISGSAGTGKTYQMFNLLRQIPEEIPMILFVTDYEIENFIMNYSKEQRKRIVLKEYNKYEDYKKLVKKITKKNKILIYTYSFNYSKNYQDQMNILEIIENINLYEIEKPIKVVFALDFLCNSFFNKFEKYLKLNNKEKISYIYLSQEGRYNDLFNINIYFKNEYPEINKNFIKKCKETKMNIRDLVSLRRGHFYIAKYNELKPIVYKANIIPRVEDEEVNLEDYKHVEIQEKIENF